MSINLSRQPKPMISMHVTVDSEQKVVKHALYNALRVHGVKQEIIANTLEVHQSTVSRMINPHEEQHLSVAQLSVLHNDPFTAPVADEILQSIGARFNVIEAEGNGSLLDELLAVTQANGTLAQILADGVQPHEHDHLMKLAAQFEDIANHIRTEVKAAKR